MKCPTCESCEYEQYCGATEIMRKCERHNKKVEQTNEEWFCSLTTEEKAKVFANATCSSAETPLTILWGGKEAEQKKWEQWLKEMHDGNT